MALQLPLVTNRLVALLPALPGWGAVTVFDGPGIDIRSQAFCTVGFQTTDGLSVQYGSCATALDPSGFRYTETGSVPCQITWTDDRIETALARTTVFAWLDQLDQAIRADRTLAVLSPDSTCALNVDATGLFGNPGLSLTAAFTLAYTTVT